jgi:hypothetical protein
MKLRVIILGLLLFSPVVAQQESNKDSTFVKRKYNDFIRSVKLVAKCYLNKTTCSEEEKAEAAKTMSSLEKKLFLTVGIIITFLGYKKLASYTRWQQLRTHGIAQIKNIINNPNIIDIQVQHYSSRQTYREPLDTIIINVNQNIAMNDIHNGLVQILSRQLRNRINVLPGFNITTLEIQSEGKRLYTGSWKI